MTVKKAAEIKITAKTDQAQNELKKLADSAKKAEDSFNDMGKNGQRATKGLRMDLDGVVSGAKAVALGVTAAAVGMDRVIMAGARYTAILQNLPFSIDAATAATQGFISKTALMDAALLAERAGIAKTSEEFADFAKNVQKVAASRGQDASEAMDVLTRALSRNETELLDNYGVILKVTQAKEIYRKQIEATGRAYTDEDDAAAFAKVGMQKLRDIAAKSTTELDEFTASWMRLKARVTDLPAAVYDAREAIYDNLVALDEWDSQVQRNMYGITELIGDHRRGVGFRGLAAAAREAAAEMWLSKEMADTGTVGAVNAYVKREVAKAEGIIKITSDKLTSGLENAAEARIFGTKSKHKKHAEDIILIYDNTFEEFSERQRLMAMESNAQIENALAARTSTGTMTSDPFQRDPKEDTLAAQELAAAQRQIEIDAARAKEDDLAAELDRINREQAAQMDYAAFMERTATSELEMMEAKESMRQAQHDAQLGRIAVEIKAEEKRKAKMQQIGGALSNVHGAVAAAAIRGAISSGESARGAVKHLAAAKAQEMLILGVTEQIQAIACFAMLNIPQGIAHQTAAGLAFGQAAIFGATYGVMAAGGSGGGSSRASVPSTGSSPSLVGGDSGGNGGGSSGNAIPQGTPISRPAAAPPPIAMRGGPSRTTQINVTNYSVLPHDSTAQMLELRRMLAKSEREDGPA